MVDFFKFKESLEEAKAKQAKKPSEVYEDELEKDADDPCWEGYVQLGTKMVDGKEVPNCVPMEEAAKQVREKLEKDADDPCQAGWVQLGMKTKNGRQVPNCVPLDEAKQKLPEAFENDGESINEAKVTDDHWAIVKQNGSFYSGKSEIKKIVKPSKNPPSQGTVEKHGGDSAVKVGKLKKDLKGMRNTDKLMKQLNEGYYDAPDYGPAGAADMAHTQLHFIMYAAEDIMNCVRKGCPMPEWYQNKLAKLEGDMEGLYSYMKGKTRKMQAHQSDRYGMMGIGRGMYEQTLTESKTVDVSVRHARKANDIASDMFRGEYKTDGSNSFVFKKADAADDFRAELKKQKVELMEAQSGDKEAYTKFFNAALKRFGVDSPAELKGDKEKEFYDYVDKNWKADDEKNESTKYVTEKLKPSDDVSKWIEDFYKSDAPQFKGKDKEARREMAVAAWLDARREAGYDVDKNPNE